MKYHVFNKKPSRSDIEKAMQYSDPHEQMEALAQSMTPAKGELWQNVNTGRVLVIRSNPMPIQGVPLAAAYVDNYGVVVADVIDRNLNVDFDIFFKLRHLLSYKKNWSSEKEIGRSLKLQQTKEIENGYESSEILSGYSSKKQGEKLTVVW